MKLFFKNCYEVVPKDLWLHIYKSFPWQKGILSSCVKIVDLAIKQIETHFIGFKVINLCYKEAIGTKNRIES